jgi:SNF2 family DNA or RNA helicase
MKYNPFPYQDHATEHIIQNTGNGLFLEMGLGKTVSTLTAIDQLLNDYLEVNKVLVIAPKRVAEDTWTTECEKWDHIRHLRISRVLGDERKRISALRQKADIYVINRENVAWLQSHYAGAWPFDMVVIDESSSFKSHKAVRFKSLKLVRAFINRVVILTGTPAPNGLLDIWAPMYLVDRGARLGEKYEGYRARYFEKNQWERRYTIKQHESYEQGIYNKIGDIVISMKAADYLDLPERIDRFVNVKLPDEVKKAYNDFERNAVLALSEEDQITAINAAALTTKLLQFANGAIYDQEKVWHEMHREKLEALEEIIEAANEKPVLVFYWYKHDLERIQKHLKDHGWNPVELKGQVDIKNWNDGKIQVLLAHPASAGHGLNLQAGGNIIVWFGLTWSLELYMQANARLHRLGQTQAVIIHHLVAMGTMDEDVMKALANKFHGQEALMQAVKFRIDKYQKLVA